MLWLIKLARLTWTGWFPPSAVQWRLFRQGLRYRSHCSLSKLMPSLFRSVASAETRRNVWHIRAIDDRQVRPERSVSQEAKGNASGKLVVTCPSYLSAVFTRAWLPVCPSSVCLSVTLVHLIGGVGVFGNISSSLRTMAILWPPCKILRRLSPGNSSVGSVKHKRGGKIERFWTSKAISHER